jgi:hypothetical protein
MPGKRQHVWKLRLRFLSGQSFMLLVPSMKYSAAARVAEKFIQSSTGRIMQDFGDEHSFPCSICGSSEGAWAHGTSADTPHKYKPLLSINKLEWQGGLDWPAA